jgi:4-hydroxybenzoate polyprenyltransferase
LKNRIILDVFVISFGFLLRVIAGAVAIDVVISNWILVCTILLALFLALSKRRHELILLDNNADSHREILREYSPYLLDQMIGVVTSATLVAYMIFTLSDETVAKFGQGMILTVPFVLYGIFRYLYLVHQKKVGGQPEEILLSDIPLQLTIIAYGIVALIVIYF